MLVSGGLCVVIVIFIIETPLQWQLASFVTPRFECAMIRSISGRQTMEHASKTFQTFEYLEVYQAVL